MNEYNAADTRAIRKATKAARQVEAARARVIFSLMGGPEGRAYVYDLLLRSHIFTSSFSSSPYGTAFAEGERNIGLQLLADVMRHAADQYVFMMQEANDRELADAGRTSRPDGNQQGRDGHDSEPTSALGLVDSEYDPADSRFDEDE